MKIKLLIISSFLFSMSVYADIEEEVVRVTGRGGTVELAIKSALIEGVKQRKGVEVSASRSFGEDFQAGKETHNTKVERKTSSKSTFNSIIKTTTSGNIQKYDVVDTKKRVNTGWLHWILLLKNM